VLSLTILLIVALEIFNLSTHIFKSALKIYITALQLSALDHHIIFNAMNA